MLTCIHRCHLREEGEKVSEEEILARLNQILVLRLLQNLVRIEPHQYRFFHLRDQARNRLDRPRTQACS